MRKRANVQPRMDINVGTPGTAVLDIMKYTDRNFRILDGALEYKLVEKDHAILWNEPLEDYLYDNGYQIKRGVGTTIRLTNVGLNQDLTINMREYGRDAHIDFDTARDTTYEDKEAIKEMWSRDFAAISVPWVPIEQMKAALNALHRLGIEARQMELEDY